MKEKKRLNIFRKNAEPHEKKTSVVRVFFGLAVACKEDLAMHRILLEPNSKLSIRDTHSFLQKESKSEGTRHK